MEYLFNQYWDPEIAEIAQYYADTCPDEHDQNRNVPGMCQWNCKVSSSDNSTRSDPNSDIHSFSNRKWVLAVCSVGNL